MTRTHAVVWIDHRVARIVDLTAEHHHLVNVEAPTTQQKLHQKRGIVGSGHVATDTHYLDAVADAVAGVERILIVGPGLAKDELTDRLRSHHAAVNEHVVAVETVDHPTERQLVAYARQRFAALDQLDGLPTPFGTPIH